MKIKKKYSVLLVGYSKIKDRMIDDQFLSNVGVSEFKDEGTAILVLAMG